MPSSHHIRKKLRKWFSMTKYTVLFKQTGRTLRDYTTEDMKKAKKRARELENAFHTKTDVVSLTNRNKMRKVV